MSEHSGVIVQVNKTRSRLIAMGVLCLLFVAAVGLPLSVAQGVEPSQQSDGTVNAYWQANGAKNIDITDQAILAVDLKQESTVTSSARITVSSCDLRFSVYPVEDTETLAPGATETIYFTVSQSGGTTEDDNVTITIDSYETYTGSLQASGTVTCNFLPTISTPSPTTTTSPPQNENTWLPLLAVTALVVLLLGLAGFAMFNVYKSRLKKVETISRYL